MNQLHIAVAAEFELSEKLVNQLSQSTLPIETISAVEIFPFSEEQGLRFRGKSVAQIKPEEMEWQNVDYLLFAGHIEHANYLAAATENGCVVIDILGICTPLHDVPLVVPNVNNHHLELLRQRNIVSLADPQVSHLALTLAPLLECAQFEQLSVTSLLSAAYSGSRSVENLAGQTARLLNGIPIENNESQRLAFDVFPQTSKPLNAQLQKVFPQLENVVFHSIHVPVFYGMSQKVTALSTYELPDQEILAGWKAQPLIHLDEQKLVTPVIVGEYENSDDETASYLYLSQIAHTDNGISWWSCADEQRFSLARLSVELLTIIYDEHF